MNTKKQVAGFIRSVKELSSTRKKVNKSQEILDTLSKEIYHLKSRMSLCEDTGAAPLNIILSDNVNIDEERFCALYDYIKTLPQNAHIGVFNGSKEAMYINNLHSSCLFEHENRIYKDIAKLLKPLELIGHKYNGISVFQCIKADLIRSVSLSSSWEQISHNCNDEYLVDFLYKYHKDAVITHIAMGLFWIDYWKKFNLNEYDIAVTFLGAGIYSSTFIESIKLSKPRLFILENFFSGGHFFAEERYTPIPNNSRLRLRNFYKKYIGLGEEEISDYAHSYRSLTFNTPRDCKEPDFLRIDRDSRKKIILLIGQNANDYSVITGCCGVISTIRTYKEFVIKVLTADSRAYVIFKAPYSERMGSNVGEDYTRNVLLGWRSSLPKSIADRFFIEEKLNLESFIKISAYVVTISSDEAIEAAIHGAKPVIIGGAYYDDAGFTINCRSPSEAAKIVNAACSPGNLTISEYGKLLRFITILLDLHLISNESSLRGARRIELLFDNPVHNCQRDRRIFRSELINTI